MTTAISIESALKMLALFRSQRLTKEEREQVDALISLLGRAQVDPDYRAYLHTPIESRESYDPSSVSDAGTNDRGGER